MDFEREIAAENDAENDALRAREKIVWFESLCKQLDDVRELRAQYERELAVTGHIPSYRKVAMHSNDKQKFEQRPLVERFGPPFSHKEMDCLYEKMQLKQRYTIETLSVLWNFTKRDVRRACFWLRRSRYIRWDRALEHYEAMSPEYKAVFRTTDTWDNKYRENDRLG